MKKINPLIFILGIILFLSFVSAECIDSDEGEAFYVKGETAVTPPGNTATSQVPVGNIGYSFDYCFKNNLFEQICINGDSTSVEYICPNECFDGFCLEDNEGGYVLTEKRELTANLGGKDYIFSVYNISRGPGGVNASFSLKISGDLEEITEILGRGESQVLSNGLLIKVTDTDAVRMYGVPASVTFTLTDTNQNERRDNTHLIYWIIGVAIFIILVILFFVLKKKK
ncbi:MAG: hypothetical protein WC584_05365 [Candidatus Pacearchaeota archaeon]